MLSPEVASPAAEAASPEAAAVMLSPAASPNTDADAASPEAASPEAAAAMPSPAASASPASSVEGGEEDADVTIVVEEDDAAEASPQPTSALSSGPSRVQIQDDVDDVDADVAEQDVSVEQEEVLFEPSRLSVVPEADIETDLDSPVKQPVASPAVAVAAAAAAASPVAAPAAASPLSVASADDSSDAGYTCKTCSSDDTTEDNLLIICETCDDAFHQQCVGVAVIPEDDWFCNKCAPKPAAAAAPKSASKKRSTPVAEASDNEESDDNNDDDDAAEAAEADPLAGEDVSKFTVARLRQELKTRGLPTTGLKRALVTRLADAVNNGAAEDESDAASPPPSKRGRARRVTPTAKTPASSTRSGRRSARK